MDHYNHKMIQRISVKDFILFLLLLFFIFFPLHNFSAGAFVARRAEKRPTQHINEILVKYRDEIRVRRITVDEKENFDRFLQRMQNDPSVEYAEPNYKIFSSAESPNDPFFLTDQFYLSLVHVPEAWKYSTGIRDVVVAVLDAGVDIKHPDLSRNLWVNIQEVGKNKKDDDKNGYIDDVNGYDFVSDTGNPLPKPESKENFNLSGMHHGTVVAGIIGAVGNNAKGISGVNWKTRIMPLRVLNNTGEGNVGDVIEGIAYAVKHGAKVLNMSFVGYTESESLDRAIAAAYDAGAVIVAAAGNAISRVQGAIDLDVTAAFPVCSRIEGRATNFVLGVSALTVEDKLAYFSNYGESCIDVSAPGITMFSTQTVDTALKLLEPYGGRAWSGSSFAAPIVSGVAALIFSLNPHFTNEQVYRGIIDAGEELSFVKADYPNKIGRKLNAAVSLKMAWDAGGTLPTEQDKPEKKSGGKERFIQPRFAFLGMGEKGTEIRFFNYDLLLVKVLNNDFVSVASDARIAFGNVAGDAEPEVIVSGAQNDLSVRIFDRNGKRLSSFATFPSGSASGINVALGDVTGDGLREILVSPIGYPSSMVRIFESNGVKVRDIPVYKGLKLSLSIASGDLDGDGVDEVITGAGSGGGPQVSVYTGQGKLLRRFFSGSPSLRGGVVVASVDVDNDKRANILTLALGKEKSTLEIFTGLGERVGEFPVSFSARERDVYMDSGLYDFDNIPDVLFISRTKDTFRGIVVGIDGVVLKEFGQKALGIRGGGVGALLP
jgi:subtilisin family serine protease